MPSLLVYCKSDFLIDCFWRNLFTNGVFSNLSMERWRQVYYGKANITFESAGKLD